MEKLTEFFKFRGSYSDKKAIIEMAEHEGLQQQQICRNAIREAYKKFKEKIKLIT